MISTSTSSRIARSELDSPQTLAYFLIGLREADVALRTLKQFHIIKISKPNLKEPQVVHLEKNFASSFKLALTGGGHHNSFGIPSTDVAGAIDLAELDDYARAQWETILHYLVNSVAEAGKWSQGEGPTAQVKKLLVEGKLVSQSGRAGGITKSGFSFLLQEVNAQVWTLLILWIETAEKVSISISQSSLAKIIRCKWTLLSSCHSYSC